MKPRQKMTASQTTFHLPTHTTCRMAFFAQTRLAVQQQTAG
jgi:hypothetical protein